MKKGYNEYIKQQFSEVREAIRGHHKLTDSKLNAYAKKHQENVERLNARTLSNEENIARVILQGDIAYSARAAADSVNLCFDNLDKIILEWAIEVPPASFLEIMRAVEDFNLKLSNAEILALSAAGSGSYFSQRILKKYAEMNGRTIPGEDIATLRRMIESARRDAILSINAYTGPEISGYEWITDDIGNFQGYRRIFADSYLDKTDSSLTRLEKSLTDATDKDISLLPSESERLEKYFEDTTEETRTQRMAEILSEHPEEADGLALFDPVAFKDAKQIIVDRMVKQAAAAGRAVREASAKAANRKGGKR